MCSRLCCNGTQSKADISKYDILSSGGITPSLTNCPPSHKEILAINLFFLQFCFGKLACLQSWDKARANLAGIKRHLRGTPMGHHLRTVGGHHYCLLVQDYSLWTRAHPPRICFPALKADTGTLWNRPFKQSGDQSFFCLFFWLSFLLFSSFFSFHSFSLI